MNNMERRAVVFMLLPIILWGGQHLATGQDTTALISGILDSLTSTSKTAECPGECVHSLTAFFCERVLAEADCGSSYMSCCVPSDASFGTVVETSPPLTEETNAITDVPQGALISGQYSASTAAQPQIAAAEPLSTIISSTSPTFVSNVDITSTTQTPLTAVSPVPEASKQSTEKLICNGLCVDEPFARYCANPIPGAICTTPGRLCCLPDNRNVTALGPSERPTQDQYQENDDQTASNQNTAPTAPQCPGSCVGSFFSLLCDNIAPEFYCENEGTCCMTEVVATTTTTEPPAPPCPGTCILTILSGVCNRPSELILRTRDCTSGTICCYTPAEKVEPPILASVPDTATLPQPPFRPHQISNFQPPTRRPPPFQPPERHVYPGYERQPISRPKPIERPPPFGFPGRPIQNVQVINQHPRPINRDPRPPVQSPNRHNVVVDPRPPSRHEIQHRPPTPPIRKDHPQVPLVPPAAEPGSSMGSDTSSPPCPRPCISSYLKFTCFGNNAIYNGFTCPKESFICCAPMPEIQKQENFLRPGSLAAIRNASITTTTTTTTSTTELPPVIRTTTTAYSSFPQPSVQKHSSHYVCGIKGKKRAESARIVGGSDSSPGEWCWQVALINAQNQYLCGGTLIGSQWILTAAHCVTSLVRNGEAIYVRVGDYDLKNQHGSPNAQTLKVSTTYIHHNHNGQTLDNDIALLKLEKQVQLSESVCLVCLPARGTNRQAGRRCIVTGYGYQGENGPISLRIRKAEIPIVEEKECAKKINAVTEKQFILPISSFCAGGEEGNDACQGDGGGPLVCKVDNFYELTGLVSWGFGCGRPDVPGVYVKVSSFIGWINQIISVNML